MPKSSTGHQCTPDMPIADRMEAAIMKDPNSGCWLWTKALSVTGGYGQIGINGKILPAHRVSYECFVGPIPAGMKACHKCDTPACVNPDHLFLGTQADNMRDMDSKGRRVSLKGEDAGRAKLTAVQIEDIRSSSLTQVELAKKYGVNQTHISRIIRGEAWLDKGYLANLKLPRRRGRRLSASI